MLQHAEAYTDILRSFGDHGLSDIVEPFESIHSSSLRYSPYLPYGGGRKVKLSDRRDEMRPHVSRTGYEHPVNPYADYHPRHSSLRAQTPSRPAMHSSAYSQDPGSDNASEPGEDAHSEGEEASGERKQWEQYVEQVTRIVSGNKPAYLLRCLWTDSHGRQCGYEAKRGPVRRHIEGKHLSIK